MKVLVYQHIVLMGGAEKYLLTLLPELKSKGIEVGFFCTLQKDNAAIVTRFKTHFSTHSIPVHICETNTPFGITAAYNLAKTIKQNKYTILHTHLMHAEITSALAKLLFRPCCKLVITKHGYMQSFMDVHGLDASKINKLKPVYQVEKFVQLFVHRNFAVSNGVAQFYIKTGICKAQKMDVIYHGLNSTVDEDADHTVSSNDNQILIVGRLKKFKGHHFLLAAINELRKKNIHFKLMIVGDGEEKENLVQLVNNYQLNGFVNFVGYTDNVNIYFKGSDIVVAPSIAEPFGLIVLEAYNCNKPVVAFNVTAFNENIVDGKTGLLTTPYDIEDLAKNILYLLQNKEIAIQMGNNGKEHLRADFSLEKCVLNTISFYNR